MPCPVTLVKVCPARIGKLGSAGDPESIPQQDWTDHVHHRALNITVRFNVRTWVCDEAVVGEALCTAGKAVQLIHVLAGGLHVFMHARHIRIEPLLLLTAATSFHRCFSLLCVIIERSETCLNVLVGLTGECNLGACSQRQNPTPPDLALRCCTLEHTPTPVFVPTSAFSQM